MIHTRLHRCLSMTGETWRAQKRRSSVLGTLMLSTLPILTWCALPLPDASQIALGTWQWEIPALNGGFNGKIIYTYVYNRIYIYIYMGMFHCHVWLQEASYVLLRGRMWCAFLAQLIRMKFPNLRCGTCLNELNGTLCIPLTCELSLWTRSVFWWGDSFLQDTAELAWLKSSFYRLHEVSGGGVAITMSIARRGHRIGARKTTGVAERQKTIMKCFNVGL